MEQRGEAALAASETLRGENAGARLDSFRDVAECSCATFESVDQLTLLALGKSRSDREDLFDETTFGVRKTRCQARIKNSGMPSLSAMGGSCRPSGCSTFVPLTWRTLSPVLWFIEEPAY